jgi:hypothetical protein
MNLHLRNPVSSSRPATSGVLTEPQYRVAQQQEEEDEEEESHQPPTPPASSRSNNALWSSLMQRLCQESSNRMGWLLFFIGVWNNAPYVIMLASAKQVSEGGVALVFIANILPGTFMTNDKKGFLSL